MQDHGFLLGVFQGTLTLNISSCFSQLDRPPSFYCLFVLIALKGSVVSPECCNVVPDPLALDRISRNIMRPPPSSEYSELFLSNVRRMPPTDRSGRTSPKAQFTCSTAVFVAPDIGRRRMRNTARPPVGIRPKANGERLGPNCCGPSALFRTPGAIPYETKLTNSLAVTRLSKGCRPSSLNFPQARLNEAVGAADASRAMLAKLKTRTRISLRTDASNCRGGVGFHLDWKQGRRIT